MATAEERRMLAEEEEERELEASLAALTRQSSRLSTRLRSLQRSKAQLEEAVLKERRETAEIERRIDQEKEAAVGRPGRPGRLPALGSLVSSTIPLLSDQMTTTLRELALTARQVEEMLAKGDVEERKQQKQQQAQSQESHTTAAASASTAAQRTSMGTNGSLPSMSSESLSAFSVDTYGGAAAAAAIPSRSTTDNGTNPTLASSSTATVGGDASPSPFLLHQRALCAAYLQLDDLWAKALNTLFKALFGGGGGTGGGQAHVKESFGDEVLKHSKEHLAERAELEAIVSATPHGKHTLARMRSTTGPTAGAGTVTPARGKIGGGLTRAQSIPLLATTTEEKEEGDKAAAASTGGFQTPPHGGHHGSAQQDPSRSLATGSPPSTASSLSASLHAHYTAELTRLYESFPASQDDWLCHNLLFLSVRARIQEQHGLMVREDHYRAMTKQQVNEHLAEVGLQAAAMQRQLANMLAVDGVSSSFDDFSSSSATAAEASPSLPAGGFPALWHSLRSLQLLELLRADLSFASSRQSRYLTAQSSLQSSLLEQKARHELLLAAWRVELTRVTELAETAKECCAELTRDGSELAERLACYRHLAEMHRDTARMFAHDRLGVDARAGFLVRLGKMAQSAVDEVRRAEEGSIDSQSSSSSSSSASAETFTSLLQNASALLRAPGRIASALEKEDRERAGQLQRLVDGAVEVRREWLGDGSDVVRSHKQGDPESLSTNPNQTRLDAQAFVRLHAEVSRAVEQVADGLNALTLECAQQRAAVDGSADPLTQSHAQLADVATRSIWTEFIQAPDVLEERVAAIKKRLAAVEMR